MASLRKRRSRSAQDSPSESKTALPLPVKELSDHDCWSRSIKEAMREAIRQELECAKYDWAKFFQSRWNLEEIARQMHAVEEWMRSMEKQMRSMNKSIWEVKEAVELVNIDSPHIRRSECRVNAKSTEKNYARNLRLQFHTKPSLPIYTGMKLKGEGGAPISVTLIDANTGDVVTSGPESSIKLDIVVLEGDFDRGDEDDWTLEEFESFVVKEREGKRPLLTGDCLVTLKGGVGKLGELIFTDNSSWNRSKMFRIGLKVATSYCGNTQIREAKTDAFPVREHRGEAYRKHYPPSSDDEIWRLEMIAKGGRSHQKLNEAGIYKVEDFLRRLFVDSKKLKEILGNVISQKKWEGLVEHAKTCKIDQKLYLYYVDGMRNHGAVFNTGGQLIGLIKDGIYFATCRLSAQEREHGDTIVKKTFDNWNDVRELNGETLLASMQEKSSSSFSSQVFEEQIKNLTPVQCSLAPQVCAAPVGLEAPLVDVGSTAEGEDGITAVGLPAQLPNTNSGNAMKLLVDESVRLAAQQPISTDPLNVVIPCGDDGIATFRSPVRSPNTNSGNAVELCRSPRRSPNTSSGNAVEPFRSPIWSPNTNSRNAIKHSVDESVGLSARQPMCMDP